jgi:hypothetical protein
MAGEIQRLFESRLEDGADLLDLYDGRTAFVNAELAAVYGITGVSGTALVSAVLPANVPRAGLMGTAGFLTLQSKQDATSPTARGKWIREAVLCQEVPDPPDNLDTTLRDPPPGQKPTLREHLELHRSSPACAACHALIAGQRQADRQLGNDRGSRLSQRPRARRGDPQAAAHAGLLAAQPVPLRRRPPGGARRRAGAGRLDPGVRDQRAATGEVPAGDGGR